LNRILLCCFLVIKINERRHELALRARDQLKD
jgi:hypothetical protein